MALAGRGEAAAIAEGARRRWVPQYRVSGGARTLADFEEASELLQRTPGLDWTRRRFLTRLAAGRRVSLLHDRLKLHGADGGPDEVVELDDLAWERELRRWFGYDTRTSP